MKPLLSLAAAAALALGCATTSQPGGSAGAGGQVRSQTLRIGFWELDLVALDQEPRGTTFRLLDLKVFRLLEVGRGKEYHSFRFLEVPPLFHLGVSRREGAEQELRILDVDGLATALVRFNGQSERSSNLQVLKLPLIGSAYGREMGGGVENHTYGYVIRRQVER